MTSFPTHLEQAEEETAERGEKRREIPPKTSKKRPAAGFSTPQPPQGGASGESAVGPRQHGADFISSARNRNPSTYAEVARSAARGAAQSGGCRFPKVVCRDFRRGACKRGNTCRFAHGNVAYSSEPKRSLFGESLILLSNWIEAVSKEEEILQRKITEAITKFRLEAPAAAHSFCAVCGAGVLQDRMSKHLRSHREAAQGGALRCAVTSLSGISAQFAKEHSKMLNQFKRSMQVAQSHACLVSLENKKAEEEPLSSTRTRAVGPLATKDIAAPQENESALTNVASHLQPQRTTGDRDRPSRAPKQTSECANKPSDERSSEDVLQSAHAPRASILRNRLIRGKMNLASRAKRAHSLPYEHVAKRFGRCALRSPHVAKGRGGRQNLPSCGDVAEDPGPVLCVPCASLLVIPGADLRTLCTSNKPHVPPSTGRGGAQNLLSSGVEMNPGPSLGHPARRPSAALCKSCMSITSNGVDGFCSLCRSPARRSQISSPRGTSASRPPPTSRRATAPTEAGLILSPRSPLEHEPTAGSPHAVPHTSQSSDLVISPRNNSGVQTFSWAFVPTICWAARIDCHHYDIRAVVALASFNVVAAVVNELRNSPGSTLSGVSLPLDAAHQEAIFGCIQQSPALAIFLTRIENKSPSDAGQLDPHNPAAFNPGTEVLVDGLSWRSLGRQANCKGSFVRVADLSGLRNDEVVPIALCGLPRKRQREGDNTSAPASPASRNCTCGRRLGRSGRHCIGCPLSTQRVSARVSGLPLALRNEISLGNAPQVAAGDAEEPPNVESILAMNVPMLRSIPKSARSALAASLVSSLLGGSWEKFLIAPKLLFSRPRDGSLIAAQLRGRAALFSCGKFSALIRECAESQRTDHGAMHGGFPIEETPLGLHSQASSLDEETRKRFNQCIRFGEIKKANALLFQAKIAEPSNENLAVLQRLHPQVALPAIRDFTPSSNSISGKVLGKLIAKFPLHTSGGRSAWTARHMRELFSVPGTSLPDVLAKFASDIINGKVPDHLAGVVFGARLVGLHKKGGGIRPIAIGETLRRAAAKWLCTKLKLGFLSSTNQFGVGVKKGAEVCVLSLRQAVSSLPVENCIVKIDFFNAFNTCSREAVLNGVAKHMPVALNYAIAAYGKAHPLTFGSHVIPSTTGVHQGDPLGPIFFAAALHDSMSKCTETHSLGNVAGGWYLDDGVLHGALPAVLRSVEAIAREALSIGLVLNHTKCEISARNDSLIPQSVMFQRTPLADLTFLGSCIGDNVDSHSHGIAELAAKHIDLVTQTATFNAHGCFIVLRSCCGQPELNHTLRTQGGLTSPAVWDVVDNSLIRALSHFIPCCPQEVAIARLPIKMGGLGFRCIRTLAPFAFCASVSECAPTLANSAFVQLLINHALDRAPTSHVLATSFCRSLGALSQPLVGTQKKVSALIDSANLDVLLELSDIKMRARLQSAAARGAGLWLLPPPFLADSCVLPNPEFRVLLRHRFGAAVVEEGSVDAPNICCLCHTPFTDVDGYHLLTCMAAGARSLLHNKVRDALHRFASIGLTNPQREQHPFPDSSGCRIDVAFFFEGKNHLVDVAITHALRADFVDFAAATPGGAANEYAKSKFRHYGSHLHPSQVLHPFVCDTFGALSTGAYKVLDILGSAYAARTNSDRAGKLEVAAVINSLVMRGVASLLLSVCH